MQWFVQDSIFFTPNAADQEQDRRQTCLPEGLSAAFACCEALRASRPANGIRSVVAGREAARLQRQGSAGAAFCDPLKPFVSIVVYTTIIPEFLKSRVFLCIKYQTRTFHSKTNSILLLILFDFHQ